MAKTENSSGFHYCTTCDRKSTDGSQLYEPLTQHVLQEKATRCFEERRWDWLVSTWDGRGPQGDRSVCGRTVGTTKSGYCKRSRALHCAEVLREL